MTRIFLLILAAALALPFPAAAQSGRVLTLAEALRTAKEHHPQLQVARAQTEVANARADLGFAPLLPQVSGSAGYTRTLAKSNTSSGSTGTSTNTNTSTGTSTNTGTGTGPDTGASGTVTDTTPTGSVFGSSRNAWVGRLTATQLIYDFGQTTGRWKAATLNALASADSEKRSSQQVVYDLRAAYYNAAAAQALLKVAQDTLANQDLHLRQSQGFVKAGTRPEIDLAQALTNRANARVQLINAQNGYDVARAQLNLAMGIEASIDYDVEAPPAEPIAGEETSTDDLLPLALKTRPDLQAVANQIRAQEATVSAVRGGYFPALGLQSVLDDRGPSFDRMNWYWSVGLTLNWQIFGGGVTKYQVREANAAASVLRSQYASARQGVRLALEQARLAVRAAKASVEATHDAVVNAREQLRLAEGRYAAGVGNVIELGDSQVALTSTSAQEVQAQFNLAVARAQLALALGQE
jgi:outer membrane protein